MTLSAEIVEALRRRQSGQPAWRYFDRRVRGHMEATRLTAMRPLPPPRGGATFSEYLSRPAMRRRTAYVHIPFCRRICTFCAFFRKASVADDVASYVTSLRENILRVSETTWCQNGPPFDAIYFGGGTPTVVEPAELAALVMLMRECLPIASNCEITVESRFDHVTAAYLQTLRAGGVNRISFGVQSFDTDVRKGVGRLNTREEILDTLAAAGQLGFDNLSVDLMYNLPGQTLTTWQSDMTTLMQTPASAASVYALIPMRGSALLKQLETGHAEPLGGPAEEYAYFSVAYDAMRARKDWKRFGFQHFGQSGRETNVYNSVRAGEMDTLGLGCGAGGYLGTLAYMNAMDLGHYAQDQHGILDQHMMAFEAPAEAIARQAAYRLVEGDGISTRTIAELLHDLLPTLHALFELGLVEHHEHTLRLTANGCFWGYNITALITDAINQLTQKQAPAVSPITRPAAGRCPFGHDQPKAMAS